MWSIWMPWQKRLQNPRCCMQIWPMSKGMSKFESSIHSLSLTPKERHLIVGLGNGCMRIVALNAQYLRDRLQERLSSLGFWTHCKMYLWKGRRKVSSRYSMYSKRVYICTYMYDSYVSVCCMNVCIILIFYVCMQKILLCIHLLVLSHVHFQPVRLFHCILYLFIIIKRW